MYAIVKTGGKQYRVAPGDSLMIEKLEGEPGSCVEFTDVLMVAPENGKNIQIGTPIVANAKVSAEIKRQTKGKKIIIFKSRRRKGYRKKTGHRQLLTEVTIKDISL
jgi:large subunit ribosomal protein L21